PCLASRRRLRRICLRAGSLPAAALRRSLFVRRSGNPVPLRRPGTVEARLEEADALSRRVPFLPPVQLPPRLRPDANRRGVRAVNALLAAVVASLLQRLGAVQPSAGTAPDGRSAVQRPAGYRARSR